MKEDRTKWIEAGLSGTLIFLCNVSDEIAMPEIIVIRLNCSDCFWCLEVIMRKLGIMVVGVAVGLVITGMLIEQERQAAEENAAQKRNGLFAEICGNTVRMYEVKDGRFCGYKDTKVFESQEKAMEWVVKETDAKMVMKME